MDEITTIYFKCLRGRFNEHKLTGSTIKNHIISPFITYCNAHVSEEKMDLEPYFLHWLANQGNLHEETVVQTQFPTSHICPHLDSKEAFLQTLREMKKGTNYLSGYPLFYVKFNMMGYVDLMKKNETHNSIFGEYYYEIIEIKLAKEIKEEHILQGAFYTRLISEIQQYTPPYFYLINRTGEKQQFSFSDYNDQLNETIQEIESIWENGEIIPDAIYNTGMNHYPWNNYENELAILNKDPSLIPSIGSTLRGRLIDAGFSNLDVIKDASLNSLKAIKGIGNKKSVAIINRAKSILTNKPICLSKDISSNLDTSEIEIYIDFESISPLLRSEELSRVNYQYGTMLCKKHKTSYKPFLVEDITRIESRKKTLLDFLSFLSSFPESPIFHWGYYDRTELKKDAHHFGCEVQLKNIFPRMIDLQKYTETNWALPLHSYSLKYVAKLIGFCWSESDMEGLTASIKYLTYIEGAAKDDTLLNSLLEYNKDDLIATKKVKDWLKRLSSKRTDC